MLDDIRAGRDTAVIVTVKAPDKIESPDADDRREPVVLL